MATQTDTIGDDDLVFTLEDAKQAGFIVARPLDPEPLAEADSVAEAFTIARDALQALRESRRRVTTTRSRQNADQNQRHPRNTSALARHVI